MRSVNFLITILILSQTLSGQQFTLKEVNPFGLKYTEDGSSRHLLKLIFKDMDGDTDLDAVLVGIERLEKSKYFGYRLEEMKFFIDVQENIGNKLDPKFAPRQPFMQQFPYPEAYFAPAMGDLNNDGLQDLIVCCGLDSSSNLKPQLYLRKSVTGNDQFEIIDSDSLQLSNFNRGSLFVPELADMDKDGDLDLLMSGFNTQILFDQIGKFSYELRENIYLYAKNIGTLSQPKFYGWHHNPFELIPVKFPQSAVVGDIDNDKDIDILSLAYLDTSHIFSFLENKLRPDNKPQFLQGVNSPFNLPKAHDKFEALFGQTLTDIDGDGDLDLFVMQELKNAKPEIGYYENNLCSGKSSRLMRIICEGDSVVIDKQVFKTSGEYFVSYEDSKNCDSTVHLNLTVNANKLTILNDTLCDGDIIRIGNQTFDQTGQYNIRLSNHLGCDSIITANLTFNKLDKGVTKSQVSLKSNAVNVSYQWINCITGLDIIGANSQLFTPVVTGSYAVRVSDQYGCSIVSNCYTFDVTNTADLKLENQIDILPNPSNGVFIITNTSGYPINSIACISSDGKKLKSIDNMYNNQVDFADLPLGNYTLVIKVRDIKVFKKITISK